MSSGARISMGPADQGSEGGVVVSPVGQGVSPMARLDLNQVFPEVGGSINSVRGEIDDAFADARTFYQRQPDEVMRMCSGHSARLSEIRVRIQRVEDFHRQWKPVRTREIEPTLEELVQQYNIASRLHSVRQLDWDMERGNT